MAIHKSLYSNIKSMNSAFKNILNCSLVMNIILLRELVHTSFKVDPMFQNFLFRVKLFLLIHQHRDTNIEIKCI